MAESRNSPISFDLTEEDQKAREIRVDGWKGQLSGSVACNAPFRVKSNVKAGCAGSESENNSIVTITQANSAAIS
jgi:hypothetical protein